MNNSNKKAQGQQGQSTEAKDLLDALAGKTAEEQNQILAAAIEGTRQTMEDDISKLTRSQEEMARKLDALAGAAVKGQVDETAKVEKKGLASSALDTIKNRPIVVGAAVATTVAVGVGGVYMYRKYQDGKAAAATGETGEAVLLLDQPSAVEVSKDAAVAAALGDR
jgi:hypothetical protein